MLQPTLTSGVEDIATTLRIGMTRITASTSILETSHWLTSQIIPPTIQTLDARANQTLRIQALDWSTRNHGAIIGHRILAAILEPTLTRGIVYETIAC